MSNIKVLILAPHTDDLELHMGATVAQMIENGWTVDEIVFTDCDNPQLREACQKSADYLKVNLLKIHSFTNMDFEKDERAIRHELYKNTRLIPKYHYNAVFCPCSNDTHEDHSVIYRSAIRVFTLSDLFGYNKIQIVQPHHDWINLVAPRHVDQKVNAIQFYEFNIKDFYRNPDFAISELKNKGALIRRTYAETFQVIHLRNYIHSLSVQNAE